MDFFVYFDEDPSFMTSFHLTGADSNVTFDDIINKFAETYKEKVSIQIDTKKLKIFYVNNTIPFNKVIAEEITDKTLHATSFNLNNFDLILSVDQPTVMQVIKKYQKPKKAAVSGEQPSQAKKSNSQGQQQIDELIQHGLIYIEIKDYKGAWMTFQRARLAKESDPRPLYYLIKILIKTHRYKMALNNASTGIQLFPFDRNIQLIYAKIHAKMKSYQDAIRIYQFSLYNWKVTEKETNDVLLKIAKCLIALSEYNAALSLIISKKNHIGCIYTVADIYLAQGRFIDAVHTVLESFKITLDYTKLAKFIPNAITTDERAAMFKFELGDNAENVNTLFFCGDCLYKAGEFELALSFFFVAFSQKQKSSSVALGTLKCLLTSNSIQTFMQFCITFMKCDKEKPFVSSVLQVIPEQLVSDFDAKEAVEAKEFKPIAFESEESSFRIDDIDTFSFIVTMQCALFCSSYISQAEAIAQAISPLVLPFNMNLTIGASDAVLFAAIASFAPTIPRPLPYLPPVYVVGDRSSLTLAYRTITIHGEKRICKPIFIDGLSIHALEDNKRTPQRKLFRDRVFTLEPGSFVIMCFGSLDVKRGAMKQSDRMEFDTLEQAYSEPISSYCLIARHLAAHMNASVFVHPVLPTLPAMKEQTSVFNTILYQKIKIMQKLVSNIYLIDILPQLLDDDKVIRSEYVYNDFFVNPSYVNLVERGIEAIPQEPVAEPQPQQQAQPEEQKQEEKKEAQEEKE